MEKSQMNFNAMRRVSRVISSYSNTKVKLNTKNSEHDCVDDFSESSGKDNLEKVVDVLDQLGLVSSSTNRPMVCEGFLQGSKKKYSIGVADFWTMQNKLKYLKDRGYWNAYKKLLYQKTVRQLTYKKSPKNPDLPHIMDHKAKSSLNHSPSPIRLKQNLTETRLTKPKSSISSRNLTPTLQKCEEIKNRCINLFTKSILQQKQTDKFHQSSIAKSKAQTKSTTPTKLSHSDNKKIKNIIEKISKYN